MRRVKRDLSTKSVDTEFLEYIKDFKKSKQKTLLLAYIIEKIAGSSELNNQVVDLLGDAEIGFKMFDRLSVLKEIYEFCMVEVAS
jgi:hypothetical protein